MRQALDDSLREVQGADKQLLSTTREVKATQPEPTTQSCQTLTTAECKSELPQTNNVLRQTVTAACCGEKLEEIPRDTSYHRLLALPKPSRVGRGADLVNLLVRIPEEAVLAYPQCFVAQDLKGSADVTDENNWSCRRLFRTRFHRSTKM